MCTVKSYKRAETCLGVSPDQMRKGTLGTLAHVPHYLTKKKKRYINYTGNARARACPRSFSPTAVES